MSLKSDLNTIYTEMEALADSSSLCTLHSAGTTTGGVDIKYLEIKRTDAPADRPAALIIAGLHAREIANGPAVLEFARRLVKSASGSVVDRKKARVYPAFENRGAKFARWEVPKADVDRILDSFRLLIVPLANPEARDAVVKQPVKLTAGGHAWRGNRNEVDAPGWGVDLNRNFDIAWDTSSYYSATDETQLLAANGTTSDNPATPTFRGLSAASENETQAIQTLVADENVLVYMDVHSYGRKILLPWAMAGTQTTDASDNFQNTSLDRRPNGTGGREVISRAYNEHMPDATPDRVASTHIQTSERMKAKIIEQAGPDPLAICRSTYEIATTPELYTPIKGFFAVIPGASVDYAMSRQFRSGEPGPTYSFTMESGYTYRDGPRCDPLDEDGGFVPPNLLTYLKIQREVHAALYAMLLSVATTLPGSGKKGKSKSKKLDRGGTNLGSPQRLALEAVDAFRNRASALAFPHLTRPQIAASLSDLILHPDLANQGQLNVCGPISLIRAVVKRDPRMVADLVISLAENGTGQWGPRTVSPGSELKNQNFQAAWGMKAAHWIATASLRDDENWLIDFEGDPDGDWQISGLTTAGEMEDWLNETSLYASVSDNSTWNHPKTKSHLLGLTQDGTHDHFLMINTHVLEAAANLGQEVSDQFFLNRFPDHWVMLDSAVSNPAGRVQFDVWTWGTTMHVDVPDNVLNNNYYGAVSAQVNP